MPLLFVIRTILGFLLIWSGWELLSLRQMNNCVFDPLLQKSSGFLCATLEWWTRNCIGSFLLKEGPFELEALVPLSFSRVATMGLFLRACLTKGLEQFIALDFEVLLTDSSPCSPPSTYKRMEKTDFQEKYCIPPTYLKRNINEYFRPLESWNPWPSQGTFSRPNRALLPDTV